MSGGDGKAIEGGREGSGRKLKKPRRFLLMWARDKDSAGASLHFRPPTHSLTRHVLPRHWMTRGLLEWKNTFKYWPPSPPPIKPPPPPPSLLHSNRIENWPTLQLPMLGSCLYIFRCWCGWIVRWDSVCRSIRQVYAKGCFLIATVMLQELRGRSGATQPLIWSKWDS